MIAIAEENAVETAVRVACVDDNPDVLLLLRASVSHQADMQCVGAFGTADDLLEFLHDSEARNFPEVVLMDWSMPGMKVDRAIESMHRLWPDLRVIVYTAHDCQQVKDDAIDAGAWGLVRKTQGLDVVLNAIRRVKHGHVVLC